MKIVLGHKDVTFEIPDGVECKNFLGVGNSLKPGYWMFYILLSDTWSQFFVDEGVLFWQDNAPDEENDLDVTEGDKYFDLKPKLGLENNVKLYEISFQESILRLNFNGNITLIQSKNDQMYLIDREQK